MGLRQQIISAMETRFANILIANGYNTNLGQKIVQWPTFDPNDKDLDRLMIRDSACRKTDPDEEDDNAQSWHYKELTVNISVLTSGETTPETLRMMIEDVLKAVGVDVTWSGAAIDTDLQGDETMIDQESKKIGETRITILVRYKTPRWQD